MLDISTFTLYTLGYFGILVLSLGANLIVFVPIPYLAILLVAALSGRFDPLLLIVSGALGSALGKMVVFQACFSGQKVVNKKTKANLDAFARLFSSYAWIAVVLAAATPIPDDIVYVPLGFARYNRLKFFISTLVGKAFLVSILVYGAGLLSISPVGSFFLGGQNDIIQLVVTGAIFAILTLFLTILIAHINWSKWAEKHFPRRLGSNQ